jgi:outer membrane receptor protein involved in Fe transport
VIIHAHRPDHRGLREVTKTNAADSNVNGIEWRLYQVMEPLSLYTDGMWIDGWQESFPARPRPTPGNRSIADAGHVAFGARWAAAYRAAGRPAVQHVSERTSSPRDIADTQRIPPGGTPADSTCAQVASPQWAASLALDNLTDEEYRVHGSGVNEPGRNLIASLSWTL